MPPCNEMMNSSPIGSSANPPGSVAVAICVDTWLVGEYAQTLPFWKSAYRYAPYSSGSRSPRYTLPPVTTKPPVSSCGYWITGGVETMLEQVWPGKSCVPSQYAQPKFSPPT